MLLLHYAMAVRSEETNEAQQQKKNKIKSP